MCQAHMLDDFKLSIAKASHVPTHVANIRKNPGLLCQESISRRPNYSSYLLNHLRRAAQSVAAGGGSTPNFGFLRILRLGRAFRLVKLSRFVCASACSSRHVLFVSHCIDLKASVSRCVHPRYSLDSGEIRYSQGIRLVTNAMAKSLDALQLFSLLLVCHDG